LKVAQALIYIDDRLFVQLSGKETLRPGSIRLYNGNSENCIGLPEGNIKELTGAPVSNLAARFRSLFSFIKIIFHIISQ